MGLVLIVIAFFFATAGDPGGGGSSSPPRDPEVVSEGRQLYEATCATCHGADLRGSQTGPPFLDLTYAPNHHADEAFQRAVAFGVPSHHWNFGDMAPVPGMTREEVVKIVAYVRTQQEEAGILRDPTHP